MLGYRHVAETRDMLVMPVKASLFFVCLECGHTSGRKKLKNVLFLFAGCEAEVGGRTAEH